MYPTSPVPTEYALPNLVYASNAGTNGYCVPPTSNIMSAISLSLDDAVSNPRVCSVDDTSEAGREYNRSRDCTFTLPLIMMKLFGAVVMLPLTPFPVFGTEDSIMTNSSRAVPSFAMGYAVSAMVWVVVAEDST